LVDPYVRHNYVGYFYFEQASNAREFVLLIPTSGFGIPRMHIPMCNIQGTTDRICASEPLETFILQLRDVFHGLWDRSLVRVLVFGILLLIRDRVMKSRVAEPL